MWLMYANSRSVIFYVNSQFNHSLSYEKCIFIGVT